MVVFYNKYFRLEHELKISIYTYVSSVAETNLSLFFLKKPPVMKCLLFPLLVLLVHIHLLLQNESQNWGCCLAVYPIEQDLLRFINQQEQRA